MLKTIRPKNQKAQLRRPGLTLCRLANQKPLEELGEKNNKRVEDTKRLAPLRVRRMPPRPTLPRSEKPRRKPQRRDDGIVLIKGMLPRSRAITAIRRIIMPSTIPSQKTSGSLDDSQRLYNVFFAFDAGSSPR